MMRPLGEIMADCFDDGLDLNDIDILVPVPLHRKSKSRRGFNQSELLITELLRRLDREVSVNNLVRIQNTRSQIILSREERIKNVTNAFQVKNPELFVNKNVLLVDDVCTTGSTLNECARSLKSAGAQKVYGLVLAHGN